MNQLKPRNSAIRRGAGRVIYSAPLLAVTAIVVLTVSGLLTFWLTASGDQILPQRSVLLENAAAGATTTYTFSFTIATPGTLGSISAEFCTNDPIVGDPCTVPAGFDISGATLSAQTGEIGFSVGSGTTANQLILTRTPTGSSAQPVSYTLDNVVNPPAIGSYYVRLQTFSSDDASGAETDHGGLAFAINSGISITSKVPPYLLFCGGVIIPSFDCATASGDFINFGDFSTNATSSAQTQLLIATNAESGYAIDYGGTTLTSGNNIIPALATADISRPGVSQYGINLATNQDPPIGADPTGPGAGGATVAYTRPNLYKFVPNDVIATSSTTSDFKRYTISYIANISTSQPAGVYDSTLTYVALANF